MFDFNVFTAKKMNALICRNIFLAALFSFPLNDVKKPISKQYFFFFSSNQQQFLAAPLSNLSDLTEDQKVNNLQSVAWVKAGTSRDSQWGKKASLYSERRPNGG